MDGYYAYSNIIKISTAGKTISLTKLYPNPFENVIRFEIVGEKREQVNLKILNTVGAVVKKETFWVTLA